MRIVPADGHRSQQKGMDNRRNSYQHNRPDKP
jgi:hypothetical protein